MTYAADFPHSSISYSRALVDWHTRLLYGASAGPYDLSKSLLMRKQLGITFADAE